MYLPRGVFPEGTTYTPDTLCFCRRLLFGERERERGGPASVNILLSRPNDNLVSLIQILYSVSLPAIVKCCYFFVFSYFNTLLIDNTPLDNTGNTIEREKVLNIYQKCARDRERERECVQNIYQSYTTERKH